MHSPRVGFVRNDTLGEADPERRGSGNQDIERSDEIALIKIALIGARIRLKCYPIQ